MYASALRSDRAPRADPPPARQRAVGRGAVDVLRSGSATRVRRLAQEGATRIRLPRQHADALEAVFINTAGGIACGDSFALSASAGAGAALTLTTPAAEKVYRSDGSVAMVDVDLAVGPGAGLDWLPQETILFDRARLSRSLSVAMAADARLLMLEMLVFGREAHGETVAAGRLEDRWRVRRGGRLVWADSLRLGDDLVAQLARPSVAGGRRALATLLYVAPDAEAWRDPVREILDASGCEAGASAWNGLLAVRLLAPEIATLRQAAAAVAARLRGTALPRIWQN